MSSHLEEGGVDHRPYIDLDIKGLDHAEVLRVLFNAASPLGLGWLQHQPGDMSIETARAMIASGKMRADIKGRYRFDYVCGRSIKVGFDGDTLLRADLFDRDHGSGAAKRAVEALRSAK